MLSLYIEAGAVYENKFLSEKTREHLLARRVFKAYSFTPAKQEIVSIIFTKPELVEFVRAL